VDFVIVLMSLVKQVLVGTPVCQSQLKVFEMNPW
jgi:hypothetical protein